MLQDILVGKETSQIVLVRDSCQCDGSQLIKSVLSSLSQRVQRIHLFLFENLPQTLTDLPQHVLDRLAVHNIAGDPLGWDGCTKVTMETDLMDYITKAIAARGDKQVAIVIDSISNLILHRSASYTCQFLQKCSRTQNDAGVEISPVVALVHHGLHDDSVLNMLSHTATSVFDLQPPFSHGYHGSCHILHKKLSGKIIRTKEQYQLNDDYELRNVEEIKQMTDVLGGSNETGSDPAANLTFNLTLSDKEKEARSKVVLPYLRKPDSSGDSVVSSSGSSKIFYQPDEADDFDEEDPDDDLDI